MDRDRRAPAWPYVPRGSPAPWLALGVHAGLGLVCFGAVYTRQPADFSPLRWSGVAVLGLALLVSGISTRGLVALTRWGRLVLALGAGVLMSLAYDPQLADLGLLAGTPVGVLGSLQPSLASVGAGTVLVFWLLLELAGGVVGRPRVPFRNSLFAGGALLVGLAVVMSAVLSPLYDMGGGEPTRFLIFNVIQYTFLLAGVVSTAGGRGVRGWPFYYIGAALLGALLRNLAAGQEGLL